jgi:hypothetical protein
MIPPILGDMIVFPSCIHHCVLPTIYMDDTGTSGPKGVVMKEQLSKHFPRISIAFNINWKQ